MNIMKSNLLTQEYLQSKGFHKDNNCPAGVNRWEHFKVCDHYVSITFGEDGYTKYGFFHRNNTRNEITYKYHFNTEDDGYMAIDEFESLYNEVIK